MIFRRSISNSWYFFCALAYYNRAAAHIELKDYQKAIADYTKAIEINPNDALAYYNRGLARVLLGNKQKAITDLHKAVSLFQKQGRKAEAQKILEIIRLECLMLEHS